jgi:hypothetical protein
VALDEDDVPEVRVTGAERLLIGPRPGRWVIVALALGACAKPHTPQGLADEFVDRYYIERDHAKALSLATGIAAARVAEEKRLVEEARAAGVGTTAVQPHLYYKLLKQTPKGAGTEFTYALTIDSGGEPLKKELRVVVTPEAGQNKVSFFNESDLQ